MAEIENKKAHAIVFSIPFQGHINPIIGLALKLASKGFTITFVHTESVHYTLSKTHNNNSDDHVDFFSKARDSGLDIRYATINDGFPLDFDRDLNFDEFGEAMLRDFPARVDEFVEKTIETNPCSINFLVADTSYAWLPNVARKHNLVSVSFWTQPALVFSFLYHLDLLQQNGHLSCKGDVEEEINYIPGVESTNTREMMPYLKEEERESLAYKAFSLLCPELKKTDFFLHNTVQELELGTISALNEKQPNYAIGPANFFQIPGSVSVTKSLWPESDCNDWLNSKPPSSVMYVSFGSLVLMSKHVIEEIAYALLLSEVNFIWVVRSGILGSDPNTLPAGFEDEIKDKGLIIPWCDQIRVLSNPAVGGFLTHCGWNSILESMWCGVPMLCYPITYEQPTNRKLVVDDWKIGVNLCDGPSIRREKIGEKIKSFISGISSERLKPEIKKVQSIVKNAIGSYGSSERNFDRFVEDLMAKLQLKTEKA